MSLCDRLLQQFPEKPPYLESALDEALIIELLPDKPNRVKHILGVVAYARAVGETLGIPELEAVALAHDIGYAEDLRRTGFHPLDGAIFLAHRNADEAIIHAVLHHTGAREEAKLWPKAASFYRSTPYQPTVMDEAITFCDTQTSPIGERVTIEERISEIEGRYGPGTPPSKVMRLMQPEFESIYDRISKQIQSLRP